MNSLYLSIICEYIDVYQCPFYEPSVHETTCPPSEAVYRPDRYTLEYWETHASRLASVDWMMLCKQTTRLPESFFLKYLDKCSRYLVFCESISYSFWETHCFDITHGRYVVRNPAFTYDDWKHLLEYGEFDLRWVAQTVHTLPLSFWEEHVEEDWDWCSICRHQQLPVSFWEAHTNKIDWYGLSFNKSLPDTFWDQHVDKINWWAICHNSTLSESFWRRHAQRLNWTHLCRVTVLPLRFWEDHLDSIYWGSILCNPGITLAFLEKHCCLADIQHHQRYKELRFKLRMLQTLSK